MKFDLGPLERRLTPRCVQEPDGGEGRLRRIEEALARLDQGCFGYCSTCGRPISVERLRIDPTITECRRCASAADAD